MPPRDRSPLHQLAQDGLLTSTFATAEGAERRALFEQLYLIVWPITFARITRPAELKRGHTRCAIGFDKLMPKCADRFHDDVAAVIHETVRRACGVPKHGSAT